MNNMKNKNKNENNNAEHSAQTLFSLMASLKNAKQETNSVNQKDIIKNLYQQIQKQNGFSAHDIIVPYQGKTALHQAVLDEDSELLKILIELLQNAKLPVPQSLQCQDKEGNTPLLLACKKLYLGTFRDEITSISNPKELTAFLAVLEDKAVQIVGWLLKYGAAIDVRDKDGYTPLLAAIERTRSPKIVKLLCEKGAAITNKTGNQDTVFHLVIAGQHHALDLFKILYPYAEAYAYDFYREKFEIDIWPKLATSFSSSFDKIVTLAKEKLSTTTEKEKKYREYVNNQPNLLLSAENLTQHTFYSQLAIKPFNNQKEKEALFLEICALFPIENDPKKTFLHDLAYTRDLSLFRKVCDYLMKKNPRLFPDCLNKPNEHGNTVLHIALSNIESCVQEWELANTALKRWLGYRLAPLQPTLPEDHKLDTNLVYFFVENKTLKCKTHALIHSKIHIYEMESALSSELVKKIKRMVNPKKSSRSQKVLTMDEKKQIEDAFTQKGLKPPHSDCVKLELKLFTLQVKLIQGEAQLSKTQKTEIQQELDSLETELAQHKKRISTDATRKMTEQNDKLLSCLQFLATLLEFKGLNWDTRNQQFVTPLIIYKRLLLSHVGAKIRQLVLPYLAILPASSTLSEQEKRDFIDNALKNKMNYNLFYQKFLAQCKELEAVSTEDITQSYPLSELEESEFKKLRILVGENVNQINLHVDDYRQLCFKQKDVELMKQKLQAWGEVQSDEVSKALEVILSTPEFHDVFSPPSKDSRKIQNSKKNTYRELSFRELSLQEKTDREENGKKETIEKANKIAKDALTLITKLKPPFLIQLKELMEALFLRYEPALDPIMNEHGLTIFETTTLFNEPHKVEKERDALYKLRNLLILIPNEALLEPCPLPYLSTLISIGNTSVKFNLPLWNFLITHRLIDSLCVFLEPLLKRTEIVSNIFTSIQHYRDYFLAHHADFVPSLPTLEDLPIIDNNNNTALEPKEENTEIESEETTMTAPPLLVTPPMISQAQHPNAFLATLNSPVNSNPSSTTLQNPHQNITTPPSSAQAQHSNAFLATSNSPVNSNPSSIPLQNSQKQEKDDDNPSNTTTSSSSADTDNQQKTPDI